MQPVSQLLPVHTASPSPRPLTVWLTGISGAGKSTLSIGTCDWLAENGIRTLRIDGDELRGGLCDDLGFAMEDRLENVRRAAQVARLFNDQGWPVLVSMISPLEGHRQLARDIVGSHRFIEVYVHADLECCRKRDPKGLYARVGRGEVRQFTGISSAYEPPRAPALTIDTTSDSVEDCVLRIGRHIRKEAGRVAWLQS